MKIVTKKNIFLIFSLLLLYFVFLAGSAGSVDNPILSVSSGCTGSKAFANLTWTFSATGTPSYSVLRKIEGQASFTQIAQVLDSSYRDEIIDSDKNYIYQIRAQSGANTYYSNQSSSSAAYCPPFILPPIVSPVKDVCDNNGPHVILNWIPVSGSVSTYEIYRDGVKISQAISTTFYDGPNIEGTKNYNYFIRARWQNGTTRDSVTAGAKAPSCPPFLSLTSSCLSVAPGGPQINLSWNNLLGTKEYQIFRKAQSEPDFSYAGTSTQANYSDNLLDTLPTYYQGGQAFYRVKAIWPNGEQKDSLDTQIEISQCSPFLKVESVCGGAQYNIPKMYLSWTATKDATLYNVYRDEIYQDQITTLGYVDSLSAANCQDTVCDHTYKIEANVPGFPNFVSNFVTKHIDCKTTVQPPSPAPILQQPSAYCKDEDSHISVSWTPSDNITFYKLYRSGVTTTIKSLVDTYYDDPYVQAGHEYNYWVTAFGGGGSVSSPNNYTVTALSCVSAPPTPSTVTLTKGCETGEPIVNVSWSESAETHTYEIWRGLSINNLSLLMTFNEGDPEFNSRSFKDVEVAPSVVYYYQVVSKGYPGGFSTPSSNKPFITTDTCLPDTPLLSSGAICDGAIPAVNLSWTANPVNILRYEIFRNDFGTTIPVKIIYDTSVNTWKDTGVSQRTIYNYTISAVGYGTPASKAATSSQVIVDSCVTPGPFTLASSTFYCFGPYPRLGIYWTPSSNALSFVIYANRLYPDNTIADTTVFEAAASPAINKAFGNALSFDGSDYVSIPSYNSLKIVGDMTISLWVRPPADYATGSSPWYYDLISKAYEGEFYLNMYHDGRVDFHQGSTGSLGSTGAPYMWCYSWYSLSPDTWVNVTVVRNIADKTIKFYKDGILQSSNCSTWVNAHESTWPLKIGRGSVYNYFKGTIDQVRIYNRSLSDAEVNGLYNETSTSTENGLVGYWGFEEGSGQEVSDSSNKGNDGTLGPSPYDPTWVYNGIQSEKRYTWQVKATNWSRFRFSDISKPAIIPICPPAKPGLHLGTNCQSYEDPKASLVTGYFSFAKNAVKYEVYRQGKGLIATIAQTTSNSDRFFEDLNLSTSTPYTYYVKAIGSTGLITESDHLTIISDDCIPYGGIPDALTATFLCNGSYPYVGLRWGPSRSADYFTLYRTISSAPFPLTVPKDNYSYNDVNVSVDTNYDYQMVAFGPGGVKIETETSTVKTWFCIPSTPNNLTISTDCQGFDSVNTVHWRSPVDNSAPNTTSYLIYRKTSNVTPNLADTPIITIDSNNPIFIGSSHYWSDNLSLLPITTYYYWVKAVGPAGESAYAPTGGITTRGCSITPRAPTLSLNSFCKNNIPYATLSWGRIPNAFSYNIFRNKNVSVSSSTYPTRISPFTDRGTMSLYFDGKDDYVNVGTSTSLQITGSISIEAWVNTSYPGWNTIAKKGDTKNGYFFGTNSTGQLYFAIYSGGILKQYSIGPAITDGIWHYVGAAWDAGIGRMYFYLDGKTLANLGFGGSYPLGDVTNSPLKIGYASSTALFNGSIHSVRIYDRPIYYAEIQNHYKGIYNNEYGLRMFLSFDEESGLTVFDQSGNGNNGRLINGPIWQTDSPLVTKVLPLENKKDYIYTVQATGYGVLSPMSNEVSVNKDCLPKKPILEVASNCNGSISEISLSWGSDPNTEYWSIYRRREDESVASTTNIFNTTSTSYDDSDADSDIVYEYHVTAVGNEVSATSDYITKRTPICGLLPSKPAITVNPQCAGYNPQMLVKWDSDPSNNTVGYYVWRKADSEPDFTNVYPGGLSAAAVEYLENVDEGEEYIYKIEAVGKQSGISVSSSPSIATTSYECSKIKPSAFNLTLLEVYNVWPMIAVSMVWTDAGNEEYYDVLRSDDGGASFNAIDRVTSSSPIVGYVDNKVQEDHFYQYTIRAGNINGVTFSNTIFARVLISLPGDFRITGNREAGKIRLKWDKSLSSPAGGTITYTIYRTATNNYIPTTFICSTSTAPLECYDNNPSSFEKYYWAVAQNNGGSKNSTNIWQAPVYESPIWREIAPY